MSILYERSEPEALSYTKFTCFCFFGLFGYGVANDSYPYSSYILRWFSLSSVGEAILLVLRFGFC